MNAKVRIGAVGAMAVVTALSVTVPAHAAPGWRVTATPDKESGLRGLAAVDAKHAWAAGYQVVNDRAVPVVRSWNGKTWTKMSLPSSVKGAYLGSVSASSSTNVWVSGSNGRSKQYWLRWNGKSWAVVTSDQPKNSEPNAPKLLAIGTGDVWSFGLAGGGPFTGDVRHYDGRKWSKVKTPGYIAGASAVSGKEIWATGWINGPGGPVPSVLRWDGKTWKKQAEPLGADARGGIEGVLALNGKNVWASGADSAGRGVLLHWNGKTWSKTSAPVNARLRELVSDGDGGLWTVAGRTFLHYKSGKWTSVAVPGKSGLQSDVSALARIPKTTSVWGAGALVNSDAVDKSSVLLKYGA
ncbi:hypothetical protein [Actinomadura roseirufa]|uniref:hypothetical protein n=1 Tax=Actinomadura roseirufa TaxID=2094049 RepID=UPI001040EC30|nr:hypothetical protein [Actinomadura roseirufa]